MNILNYATIGCFWVLSCNLLLAQASEVGSVLPKELKEYLSIALENNAGLQAFEAQYQAALARVPQASALPDPRLSVMHFVESIETRTGPQKNVFELSQTFPWWGKLDNREKAALYKAEALWYAYKSKELALVDAVSQAYYEYAYLGRATVLSEEKLKLLKELAPIVSEKVKVGSDVTSLLRLQVEMGKDEDKLYTLKQQQVSQSSRFYALLNAAGDERLPWPEWGVMPQIELDREYLKESLLANNPDLNMLRRSVESLEAQEALAKLKSYPNVTLGVRYFDTGEALNPNTTGSGEDPWAVMLSLNLPIWNKKNKSIRNEAVSLKRSAEDQLMDKENILKAQLIDKLALLKDAHRRVKLYEQDLLPKARHALEISQSSYEAASTSMLEVIDSERSLIELELLYWRAATDVWKHRIYIQILMGQPLL